MDLLRAILLDIEARGIPETSDYYYSFEHENRDAVADTLVLLLDRGLISATKSPTHGSHPSNWYAQVRVTWEGHDFLDTVRDDEIWRKTKDGAKQAGGFTFDLMKSLAKGLVKQKIESHTGIKLDL